MQGLPGTTGLDGSKGVKGDAPEIHDQVGLPGKQCSHKSVDFCWLMVIIKKLILMKVYVN